MSWGDPEILATLPFAIVAALWILHRRRGIASLPRFASIKRLWADRRGLSDVITAKRRQARGIFLALATLCTLAALARPQWGTVEEPTFDEAREVVIALDLSRSMLADDVKPTRLARAKLLLESLLEQLKGERVGLVVFAGTAFVQSPLSADYEVMRDLLKDLDPTYLPQGGTDYGAMLRAASTAFGQTGEGDRFLVVLSDGEAHDEGWQAQMAVIQKRGIRIIGVGVGTAEGAMLPDERGGLLKDENGGVVLSRLEPRTLQQLAEQTHGVYRDAATWVDIADLVHSTVDQGVKGQYVEHKQVHQLDQFQWFLAPALIFFMLSFWIELPVLPMARTLRRPRPAPRIGAADTARAAALLLAILIAPHLCSAAAEHTSNALEATVAELSAKPELAAADYAQLAQQTIGFASKPDTAQGPIRTGVIDDALAAVSAGEAADAHAADWPTLRKQLEQLKQEQQQQPQEQPPHNDQQQQEQSGGAGQQDQQKGQQGDESRQSSRSDKQPQAPSGQSGEQPDNQPQRSHSAEPRSKDQQTEQNKKNTGGAGAQPQDKHENASQSGDNPQQNSGSQHEVADNKQQKPLISPETGWGQPDAEEPRQAPQTDRASQPATRMVGGGAVRQDKTANGDPALADALGKMEHVKDADAPSVLFERMSQADRPNPARKTGKNW